MDRAAAVVCVDGLGPEYVGSPPPRIAAGGYSAIARSMVPSVTNVNNVSILTGEYPDRHGITSNYFFDRRTGREVYMESPEFIRTESVLEWARNRGYKTALITSKDKLRLLLSRGAVISFSAERPPGWLKRELGAPPSIYSVDVDIWLMRASVETAAAEKPDLVYIATTDYAMHMYGPRDSEARRHAEGIWRGISDLMEVYETMGRELLLCVTADHGMSRKSRAVNLELVLREHGIDSRMNTIIADRYVRHHSNLGGAVYIYLERGEDLWRALEILEDTEGVEAALTGRQASRLFHLDEERIGDLLVLGEREYVFGPVDEEVKEVSMRSHGSLHEAYVPIMINRPIPEASDMPRENKDLARIVMSWLAGKGEMPGR